MFQVKIKPPIMAGYTKDVDSRKAAREIGLQSDGSRFSISKGGKVIERYRRDYDCSGMPFRKVSANGSFI